MIGTTISHYKILEKLGEGGMGVVYKAHDTKLDRDVALKFLPAHLSASEEDKARFIQEAKAAATLDHPNICTIHAIDEHEGPASAKATAGKQLFIAMQFVDGQLLRDRMSNLAEKHALEFGIQIAEGLAAAHENGIVHRDVKPENIMVRKDGIIQIMDFGLAKLKGVSRLTKEGSTVGTAGYMSPEQIQGQEADHRSDIFSLGVLLYEMLTGQLPFKGVHETAIAYEIVNVDATPMSVTKDGINPELDRIVLECLEKEPSERFQSAAEIAKELRRYKRESSRKRTTRTIAARRFDRPEVPEVSRKAGWQFLWPAFSGLLFLALIVVLMNPMGSPSLREEQTMRFPINLSVTRSLEIGAATLAMAPDGKHFVYLAGAEGASVLYLRALDDLEATPLAGTDGAGDPFFSADGQWIGFFADGKIRRMSIHGGGIHTVCEVNGVVRGGYWDDDDTIWFGHLNSNVFKVPASGGSPVEATVLDTLNGEISHRFPQVLPGGEWIIYTGKLNNISTFSEALIVAENLETHERKVLVRGGSWGRYLKSGHLMYARGNALYAMPFDIDRMEVTDPPLTVVEGGMLNPFSGTANFEVSETGILIYTPAGAISLTNNVLAWLHRDGTVARILPEAGPYANARLSPDGSKIVTVVRAANDDIWTYDLERRALSRLTFGGGNSDFPMWAPNGIDLLYYSERGRTVGLFRQSWDGSGETVQVGYRAVGSGNFSGSVTPDGKTIISTISGDIFTTSNDENADWDHFIESDAFEDAPQFSPDGSLVAYLSDESGREEIYVVPYPGKGGKWQVSTGGASSAAIWGKDGESLYYTEGGTVMKVTVSGSPTPRFSPPESVCEMPGLTNTEKRKNWTRRGPFDFLDISVDEKQFLITVPESRGIEAKQVNVVVGFFGELDRMFAGMRGK